MSVRYTDKKKQKREVRREKDQGEGQLWVQQHPLVLLFPGFLSGGSPRAIPLWVPPLYSPGFGIHGVVTDAIPITWDDICMDNKYD